MNYNGKKGVDISSNNGDIDIQKIKNAGYDFVMIRLGYGSDLQSQDDSRFESNVKKCEKIGMPWGAYLYSYALNTDDAKSEAEHTIRLLKGKKPTFPIAFDMEDADGYKAKHGAMKSSLLISICKTYLSQIEKAGYYPMLYSSLYFIRDYLNDNALIDKYDIWVAQWYSKCEYSGKTLGMWQYGGEINYLESNTISGVGIVDKDKSFKNYPDIIKNGGYNNWKKSDASNNKKPTEENKDITQTPSFCYCVKTKYRGWLPTVTDLRDFAGVEGDPIIDFALKVSVGKVWYQAHIKGGDWLPKVSGFSTTDTNKYAGNDTEIDAIRIYYSTPDDLIKKGRVYKAKYRTSPINSSGYFDWQYDDEKTNGQDGYAGCYGKAIDKIQVTVSE